MSMEDRLGEGVEVGEDLAALGAEGVGVVEDRGDAALLVERREAGSSGRCSVAIEMLRRWTLRAEPSALDAVPS